MREKFNELFPYGIDFDSAGHGTIMQNRYDELGENQIEYIENATLAHADMYEMLKLAISLMDGDSIEDFTYQYKEIESLLKRARGE
jgi:hypothetical protein